ncbi:MAG TPA: hypothetical protein VJO35_16790 [Terriglobales bacterium]|nr:hypothetical protein [Terriglobales bacterium]
MCKLSLSVCLAFAFFVATAVAQMAPGNSQGAQGTQNSSPSMQQPGQYPSQQQPGAAQPTSDQNTTTQSQNNGEHTIKGCVQSQGGSSVLETKKGKQVALSGQDVSAHNGHEVALKGTWEKGSGNMSSASASSSNAGSSEKTFNVTSVKMISETCKMKGGSNTGTASPSGTGPTTAPPQ